jgi:hypothetical protein
MKVKRIKKKSPIFIFANQYKKEEYIIVFLSQKNFVK